MYGPTSSGHDDDDDVKGDDVDGNYFGSAGDDTMKGGDADEFMMGGAGNDTLKGNDGEDILFGDCEDYAIAKYVALKMLGFSMDETRVVAVKDLNLKVGHAILVVFVDGKAWVLDNQIPQGIEAAKIRHYDPVFSINEKYWWRHMR
ncbi:MAG: hypothetical protein FJX37_12840 [Alphaproteobacteria bacterium]|nr:hypothetical protein [Alphaproteobacteria bacterium]